MAVGLVVIGIAMVLVVPTQYIALKTKLYSMNFGARWCHWAMAKALGFRITRRGAQSTARPLLVASNHISWTDILIVGSMTDGSFIARGDMAGWPLLGWLATLQRTVFVDRKNRRTSGTQAADIGKRMVEAPVILFAEGTTGDGNAILKFNSTLFGAADLAIRDGGAGSVFIQPMAIAYTRLHGMPMGRQHRPLASWIGDNELWPHIKQLLREGGMDVEVIFGEPIEYTAGSKRKVVAKEIEERVRAMMATALRDARRARPRA
jgi:1-acyl-sn-glycerol-3-phosphate acyltransferase